MVPGLERPSGRAPSLIRAHVPGSRQSATRPPSTRVNGVRSWGLGSSGGRGRDPGTSVAICRGPGAEDPYLPGSQRQVHHPLGSHPVGLPSCWVGNSGLAPPREEVHKRSGRAYGFHFGPEGAGYLSNV